MRVWIAVIVVVGILAAGAYYRVVQLRNQPDIRGIDEIQASAGMPVRVHVCRAGTVDDVFTASGTIEPIRSAVIAAEVAGRVEAIPVRTGQLVRRGEVLLQLDATTARLGVRQAEEALRQARQSLEKLQNGSRPEEIELARAQMEQARADLNLRQLERERFDRLYAEEATTLQMKQQAEAACAAAAAAFEAAAASYQLVRAGPRQEDIALAEIAVAQAQTALDQARDRLADFTLRAPFDGTVTLKQVEVGDIVDFKQPLFRLMDTRRVYTDVDVSELHIGQVTAGMSVTVTVDALGRDESFEGTVTEINPASTGSSRSYLTRVEMANPDGRLRQGMFARAAFLVDRLENVLLVPDDAVRTDNGSSYVLAVNAGQVVEKVAVTPGRIFGDRVLIESGLEAGMKIITLGLNIEPGQRVTLIEDGQAGH